MADLASTDVTITVEERTIVKKKRRNRVKIVFGDGALTYPSGGVPMPAFGSFGFVRNLDFLILIDSSAATGTVWKYDKANAKLRGFEGDYAQAGDEELVELDAASDAPAAQTLYAEAVGW